MPSKTVFEPGDVFDPASVAELEVALEDSLEEDLKDLGPKESETLFISDLDDDSQQTVVTAGATADPLKDYLRIISRISLLTAEDEVRLAKVLEAGILAQETIVEASNLSSDLVTELEEAIRLGAEAKQSLVEANLRLVVSLAKRYTGLGLPFLDLIQEGNIGMMHAVDKFDYKLGYKFSTYATWWIRQAMSRAIADKARVIRIPVHVFEKINQLQAAAKDFEKKHLRVPSVEELASLCEMSVEKIDEIKRLTVATLSLDHVVAVEDGLVDEHVVTIYGLLSEIVDANEEVNPDQIVSRRLLKDKIQKVLNELTEREAGIISLRFGLNEDDPKTLDEIGRVYGVTRERIRQIETEVLGKLRELLESERQDLG